jgi:hypothetical protein
LDLLLLSNQAESELAEGHEVEGHGWCFAMRSRLEMLRGKGRARVSFEVLLKGHCFFAGLKGNRGFYFPRAIFCGVGNLS